MIFVFASARSVMVSLFGQTQFANVQTDIDIDINVTEKLANVTDRAMPITGFISPCFTVETLAMQGVQRKGHVRSHDYVAFTVLMISFPTSAPKSFGTKPKTSLASKSINKLIF